ncbi:hypothetical protein [Devosia sp. 2618]|uniref:hypothetical protein n=1 Tax=Devosia sp. 2618 TaxID=3156454 RepID=UPI003396D846
MGKLTAVERSDYATKLVNLTDEAFVAECSDMCWLSAFAGNNPTSKYHCQVDLCYDEAKRREKPWLYQRGWNQSYRLAGHTPTEADELAAKEPTP